MRFGLIGSSLDHSFSKSYFTNKFDQLDLDYSYDNLEFVSVSDLRSQFDGLKNLYKGLNVTIPYKTAIIPLLDEVDSIASKINAINCIALNKGRTIGYNTDYHGFVNSVSKLIPKECRNAYLLGSGGASKAVKYALEECFHIPTTVVSRGEGDINYESSRRMGFQDYSILVNTTPLGMYPDIMTCPDIDYSFLNSTHLCIDLIYNPEETIFLTKCREQGATIKNGYEMLVNQAELSWELWMS